MAEPTANPTPGQQKVFKRLTVDTHFNLLVNHRVLIEWALVPDFIGGHPGPYTFTVYWAEAPTADNWVPITQVVDQPWAYDNNPKLPRGKGMDFFYKVELEDGLGRVFTSQAVSATTYWGRYDWTLAREIIRKETMLMRKRTGVKGWLFKRRSFGETCDCTDPETGQIMNPNCDECYGTGLVGGYYAPYEYWVTFNPGRQLRKLDAQVGLLTENIETVRALAYPSPSANDFWVHAETDQRYIIMGDITTIARHRGVDLILDLRFEERGRSDPIYQVPIPCEGQS